MNESLLTLIRREDARQIDAEISKIERAVKGVGLTEELREIIGRMNDHQQFSGLCHVHECCPTCAALADCE